MTYAHPPTHVYIYAHTDKHLYTYIQIDTYTHTYRQTVILQQYLKNCRQPTKYLLGEVDYNRLP